MPPSFAVYASQSPVGETAMADDVPGRSGREQRLLAGLQVEIGERQELAILVRREVHARAAFRWRKDR